MDKLVKAIRADHLVGIGSCAAIDECWTDEELADSLEADGITTEEAAVQWARTVEKVRMERMLDRRWGEDSDPELKMYEEWKGLCKKYGWNG